MYIADKVDSVVTDDATPRAVLRGKKAGLAVAAARDPGNSLLLVDELEDVRRVDEDADRTADSHRQKDEQLQSVDHHRDVPPVFYYLHHQRVVNR